MKKSKGLTSHSKYVIFWNKLTSLTSDHDFAQSHLERDLSNLSLYTQGEFRRRNLYTYHFLLTSTYTDCGITKVVKKWQTRPFLFGSVPQEFQLSRIELR